MKKILSLLLAITLVFALVACSNEKDTTSEPDTSTTQTETESTDNTETTDSSTTDESLSDTKKDTYGLKWNIKEHGVVLAKFLKENGTAENGELYCKIDANQYTEDYSVLGIINLGEEQLNLTWEVSAKVDENNEPIISTISIIEKVSITIENPTERETFVKNTLGKLENYIFYEEFTDKTNKRLFRLGRNGTENYSTVDSIPEDIIKDAASPTKTSITIYALSVKDIGTAKGDLRVSNNMCVIRLFVDFSGAYTE